MPMVPLKFGELNPARIKSFAFVVARPPHASGDVRPLAVLPPATSMKLELACPLTSTRFTLAYPVGKLAVIVKVAVLTVMLTAANQRAVRLPVESTPVACCVYMFGVPV